MIYETYMIGNYQVIKFNEVLTFDSNIDELADIVNSLIKKNIFNIAIHFKDDSLLYSVTAVVLVNCYNIINHQNGAMVLVNVNQGIRDYLSIINFGSEIKMYNSEEELEFETQEKFG